MNPSEEQNPDEGSAAKRTAKKRSRASKRPTKSVHRPHKPKQGRKVAASAARRTKNSKVQALLKRPGGATIGEIQKATAWQAHSVRGFISGTLRKKMGLNVVSTKRENGERTYLLSLK